MGAYRPGPGVDWPLRTNAATAASVHVLQVLLAKQTGAVFMWARRPVGAGPPFWRVFLQEGSGWTPVARMERRPSQGEEAAQWWVVGCQH